jgi:hypothetical protein
LAAVLLIVDAEPVLAEEWYVAQDPTTKQCKIVSTEPDGKTSVIVGDAVARRRRNA